MRRGLRSSLALHLAVLLLVIFGLPHFSDDEMMVAAPIPVEIVTSDQAAQAPPRLRTPPPAPTPPKPAPVVTPPPPPPPPEPVPDDIPTPQPDAAKPTPVPAQVTPPKPPRARPPVPVAQRQQKPPAERPKPNTQFSSLLNDLAKTPDEAPAQEGMENSPVEESPTLSQLLNSSEMDAVRQQVMSCWLEPTGLREGEKLIVEVQVQVNQDRTVRSAKVVDNSRMRADPFYRTLGESAVRALYNPRCSPLLLPPDKYTTWRTITFRFSPGEIF